MYIKNFILCCVIFKNWSEHSKLILTFQRHSTVFLCKWRETFTLWWNLIIIRSYQIKYHSLTFITEHFQKLCKSVHMHTETIYIYIFFLLFLHYTISPFCIYLFIDKIISIHGIVLVFMFDYFMRMYSAHVQTLCL